MNTLTFADLRERVVHRLRLRVKVLDLRRRVTVFSRQREQDALQRIYVINLDRKADRWRRMQRELDRFRERNGERLTSLVRRFSAIDARYLTGTPDPTVLIPRYTLADQLAVHPNPLLAIDAETRAHHIEMSRQEVAVALSHVAVWRLIAEGDVPSALVLEDDVFMPLGFASDLAATWRALGEEGREQQHADFDLLYLAFKEVGEIIRHHGPAPVRRCTPGIWEASGYILTRSGAQKLLERLPVRGPVDLWLNLQFEELTVYTSSRRIIEQRIDEPSTNSYSVLPVLSQVGVITREKPLVRRSRRLAEPVMVVGPAASGLTAIAVALSMIGYTCLSDIDGMLPDERRRLLKGKRRRLFNAYVNVGGLSDDDVEAVLARNPHSRLIVLGDAERFATIDPSRVLRLTSSVADQWAGLVDFLGLDYPAFVFPSVADAGQRRMAVHTSVYPNSTVTNLKSDRSPWILRRAMPDWTGVAIDLGNRAAGNASVATWTGGVPDANLWKLRDDTFPSNLVMFRPANFIAANETAELVLREEKTTVRNFSSAAIASQRKYLYGTFSARLRPPQGSGLITGMFLHRNGPRQEIDIEILGSDTTRMLVNVYFNPGPDGTKLEYGYRGTPTSIDLGFDAAGAFHTYEIDWQPNAIRWSVDGRLVYERWLWSPTPIPDSPLEFNVNLWHSRSTEFAGRLDASLLPVALSLESLAVSSGGPRGTTLTSGDAGSATT